MRLSHEILTSRIHILDGAMGTMIQKYGLTEEDYRGAFFSKCTGELAGNNECLNLTRPDIIKAIHAAYIGAGADIIETNTFSANKISQKEYGTSEYASQMARQGAQIARQAADEAMAAHPQRKIYVAGSIGPSSKSLSLAPDIAKPAERPYSFDDMAEAYSDQIQALIDGGADLLLIETCFDALNVKAVLYALSGIDGNFPVIISVSAADKSGRTLTGQTLEAFYTSVKHYPLLAFGINCSLGAAEMLPLLKDVASFCEVPVICYPNAGLPDETGNYTQTPSEMASVMKQMSGLLNIAGGCCGTTPAHIEALAKAMSECTARPTPNRCNKLTVSGLEAVRIDLETGNFTNIGERTNVAGSRKFARLIASGCYGEALEIAARQIEDGARIIDINMDDAMLDSTAEMQKFLRHISNDPAVSKAAIMIDSSRWDTILAGLKNAQGRCIVNSISLKEGEEEFIRKAKEIKKLGAAVVVMAFDEEGQATDYESKTRISQRAYELLTTKAGLRPEDIIFDVNVLSVGTGVEGHSRYAVDFIEAVRWIKSNLTGSYTSGGISNLSFAFRGNNPVREAMHSAFLYHAIKAGLDMGIVNPSMLQVYDSIEPALLRCVEDVILDKDSGATERLVAKAGEILAAGTVGKETVSVSNDVQLPLDERIAKALVKGSPANIKEDIMECLGEMGSAVAVIEGPLMAGMETVGKLFGEGKMFLPQVVKSAKVMSDAVAILQPYMHSDEEVGADRPVIINATVKGDVHDIGKNITGTVLTCNGFEVIDLGVMVDKDTILSAAEEHNAAIIGVSGLITPSLFRMEEICREMAARGMHTPLFVGGATTSALHTAVKLAPLYDHVYHCPDASACAVMAKKYMIDAQAFEDAQHREQTRIRDIYEGHSSAAAEDAGPDYPADHFEQWNEKWSAKLEAQRLDPREVAGYFDWKMFLAVWGFKYGTAETPEVQDIINEGHAELERLCNGGADIRISAAFYPAYQENDTVHIENGPENGIENGPIDIPFMRQGSNCLADFIPAKSSGMKSPLGAFAISVQTYAHPTDCTCGCCSQYGGMMSHAVRVTLAEAASEWFSQHISNILGDSKMRFIKPAAGYASCPDHTLKRDILGMLPRASKLGITLTESYAMSPDASICGLVFIHQDALYPEIRRITPEQMNDYASKRGMTPEEARNFLGHLLQ